MPGRANRSANEATPTAVVVPIRSFTTGKSRLGIEDLFVRAALGRTTASAALEAARGYTTYVATPDKSVARWASEQGALVSPCEGVSLNEDLEEALEALIDDGFSRVVIVLGDLPLIRSTDVERAAQTEGFFVVPDSHGTGTNLLASELPCPIKLSFGENSLRAHLEHINHLADNYAKIDSDSLARFDIDFPADLDALEALASSESLSLAERRRLESIFSLTGR